MGNVTSLFPEERNLVCDCTHEESEHTFAAGCTKCKCLNYSQIKQRVRGHTLTLVEKLEILESIGITNTAHA